MTFEIYQGDCRDVLASLVPDNSVDAVVCDPPYELGFMGKSWDKTGIANDAGMWREVWRVLKPGGHLLAFSGSRTYHRMACAIEDAGFEIRDQMQWIYSTGFPKSHNLDNYKPDIFCGCAGKSGVVAEQQATQAVGTWPTCMGCGKPIIPAGLGTALKPAHEPICVARKPLDGTVAETVLRWGTGALNIDGCRVGSDGGAKFVPTGDRGDCGQFGGGIKDGGIYYVPGLGRWPANVIHSGLEEEWARYFYCPKASKRDRDEGLDGFEEQRGGPERMNNTNGRKHEIGDADRLPPARRNIHPTAKPTELMRYLCRLVTPPGGVVLDPFMGSGSTGKAAMLEGFRFIGVELDADYVNIAKARIGNARTNTA